MLYFFLFIIFFEYLYLSISIIPIWNLKKSSVDYTSDLPHSFIIYNQDNGILTKTIEKNDNEFKEKNSIKLINERENPTDWEDIDKFFVVQYVGHFICPKGSNFLYQYNNQDFVPVKPTVFPQDTNDWDLSCFYQEDLQWIFLGFLNLNTKTNFYGKDFTTYAESYNVFQTIDIQDRILDYLWNSNHLKNYNNIYEHNMYAFVLKDSSINLCNINIKIDKNNKYFSLIDSNNCEIITNISDFYLAYFNKNTKIFYWVTSNKNGNLNSGFSTESIVDMTNKNININNKTNPKSPFQFLNKVKVTKIDKIKNTKYIYYEILYNEIKNEIYRGIIDIELNKVIFNTNETLTKFKPLSNYSMLAFTNESFYEICTIKENGKCVEKCSSGQLILDAENGNHCGTSEETCSHFILKPDNICIDSCNDKYIYTIKGNECGLCKNLYENKIYKLINNEGCLENKPENTYYINKEFEIINYCSSGCKSCSSDEKCDICYEGYKLEGNICVECYPSCKYCSEKSEDSEKQKCIECKDNFYFYNNNCLEGCPEGYFKNNSNCSKCHQNCKTCSKDFNNENENCESCESNKFLIKAEGYPSNCVNECPEGTIESENQFCIIEDYSSKILWTYIIILSLFLIIIIIIIWKKIYNDKKNENDVFNDIATELEQNNH